MSPRFSFGDRFEKRSFVCGVKNEVVVALAGQNGCRCALWQRISIDHDVLPSTTRPEAMTLSSV